MPLLALYGHDSLLDRLRSAIARGRFPQAALLSGPSGVGKQRLALWLGQALLCRGQPRGPCGECPDCRLAAGLTHPDLHWFLPIARPKAGDAAKQVDEAQAAIAEAVAERRRSGRWSPPDGTAGHWLASVRLLQRIALVTPFRGPRKVLVLGDAERLVLQDANPEAANALLKILEEPPDDTSVILTAAEPRALLPTIRSRVVPIRVGRVPDDAVRRFAAAELDLATHGALDRAVAAADGRIGLLLRQEARDDLAKQAQGILAAAASGAVSQAELALRQPPWGARGVFTDVLDALALELRARLAGAAERGDHERLRITLAALTHVHSARVTVSTNVNPQLTLARFVQYLERVA